MPSITIKMIQADFSNELIKNHGLNKGEYNVQVITSDKEIFGFAFVGENKVIMCSDKNDADLSAALISAKLREKPIVKAQPLDTPEPRFYGRTSTFNRFA